MGGNVITKFVGGIGARFEKKIMSSEAVRYGEE